MGTMRVRKVFKSTRTTKIPADQAGINVLPAGWKRFSVTTP